MFSIDRWQEIFDAMSKNKLRTFLTGISVGSGIFILVVLLGVANGFNNGIKKKFARDAASLISLWSNKTTKEYQGLATGREIKFDSTDYNLVNKSFKKFIDYKSADLWKIDLITYYKSKSGSFTLKGAMPDRLYLENASLLSGRFLNTRDLSETLKVAVIGVKVAEELFEDYTKALGNNIKCGSVNYKVIGVYKDVNDRQNNLIYIPYTTLTNLYGKDNWGSGLWYTLKPEANYDKALATSKAFVAQAQEKLAKKHKVHPDDDVALRYNNSLENAKDTYMLINGMKIFFWAIGILSLIAGIVGVSNIMLIIVKERTKELGIRKALGAQPKAIIGMIVHEAVFITSISGLLGLVLATLLLEAIGGFIQTDFITNPRVDFSVAISTVILLVLAGVLAGYFPARYAAKIKPIIALRDE